MSIKRDYYFPNTEPLAPDEMRITALGTGRPFVRRGAGQLLVADRTRQRRQVRLGFRLRLAGEFHRARNSASGHHRLFRHPSACRPCRRFRAGVDRKLGRRPRQAAGRCTGRQGRSRNTAPSISSKSRWKSLVWDTETRLGLLPDAGAEVEVHEFDFTKTGVVYDKNGVVIKSFPAIHIYDGPVSYRLEWNGLCFVFSGDTTPSQFFVDNAQGADLLIHECFNTVKQLDRAIRLSGEERDRHRHHRAHRAGGVRQVFCAGEAAPRGHLSFLQRLRHRGRDRARYPQELAGSAVAGAGSDGVQRHQGRRSPRGWR